MKGSQLTFVLIAVIALGIVGVAARLVTATDSDERALTGVPQLTEEVVDRVVFRSIKHGTTTEMALIDGQWMAGAYPTPDVWLQLLWGTTPRFDGADLVSTNTDNHRLMGVDAETGTEVQFWNGDNLIDQFIVGDRYNPPPPNNPEARVESPWSPRAQRCYLRYEDRDEVYSVYCPFPNRFNSDIRAWTDPIIFRMPLEDLGGFAYVYPDDAFNVEIIERRWAVVVDGEAHQAAPSVMEALIQEVPNFVSSGIPSAEEVRRLDLTQPDITVWVLAFDQAVSETVQLHFYDKEGGGYYVKDATKSYLYTLEEEAAARLLIPRAVFSPGSVATSTPSG